MNSKPLAGICVLILVAGCSTTGGVRSARGTGETRIYDAAVETVWPAMVAAVRSTGGAVKEENRDECYLLASYGMTAWSWGEKVGVFCDAQPGTTQVEVIMKASYKPNVTAVERAPEIFAAIEQELAEAVN